MLEFRGSGSLPDDNNKTPVLSWRCTTGMTLRPLCVATLAGTLQRRQVALPVSLPRGVTLDAERPFVRRDAEHRDEDANGSSPPVALCIHGPAQFVGDLYSLRSSVATLVSGLRVS